MKKQIDSSPLLTEDSVLLDILAKSFGGKTSSERVFDRGERFHFEERLHCDYNPFDYSLKSNMYIEEFVVRNLAIGNEPTFTVRNGFSDEIAKQFLLMGEIAEKYKVERVLPLNARNNYACTLGYNSPKLDMLNNQGLLQRLLNASIDFRKTVLARELTHFLDPSRQSPEDDITRKYYKEEKEENFRKYNWYLEKEEECLKNIESYFRAVKLAST